ncbi:hypothetical protein B0T20DRAFT_221839 [Sordaria brevicollis]|uniref:Uncharacterized protein n=1 Tax=Sordaria brevicollis TaxID=83679 RepID=A0AAE0PCR6_SORBR|nr:hypothetical protein B0T20DRAFT_221839 [Sordaria brevicollis]
MLFIHDDIILAIAGNSKLETIFAMKRLSKHHHDIIKKHERSIVKEAVKLYTGGDSSLLPALGAICSSQDVDREYLYSGSFGVLKELEIRTSRADTLLSKGQPIRNRIDAAFSTHSAFFDLPQVEQNLLLSRIKETFKIVDRLADCAAEVTSEWMEAADKSTVKKLSGQESVLEAHNRQLELIRALSPLDLAYLYHLVMWAGQAYAVKFPAFMADADDFDRLLAFKEAILRHGTIMIWAIFKPTSGTATSTAGVSYPSKPTNEFSRFADDSIRLILEEIKIFNATDAANNRMPPGLHMTMSKAFVDNTGRPSTRLPIEMEHMVLSDIRVN